MRVIALRLHFFFNTSSFFFPNEHQMYKMAIIPLWHFVFCRCRRPARIRHRLIGRKAGLSDCLHMAACVCSCHPVDAGCHPVICMRDARVVISSTFAEIVIVIIAVTNKIWKKRCTCPEARLGKQNDNGGHLLNSGQNSHLRPRKTGRNADNVATLIVQRSRSVKMEMR